MVTKQDIFKFLEDCGIKKDDYVTIHTSLRAIGEIEGGADGLIDAFCEYLSDGLFIVPTHTWANVTKDNPFYDVKKTVPCIGVLPTIAAFRPDAIRSLHPTHSVAVFGKGAEDFIKGEETSATPAPVEGCLSSLYEKGGKILLLGVGHERNTYLHAVDERLNIPDRLGEEPFRVTITDYEGNTLQSPPFRPHFNSVVGTWISEYFPNFDEAFEYAGAVTYHRLGNAKVYCCDAGKMADVFAKIWSRTDHDLCIAHEPVPEAYYKD